MVRRATLRAVLSAWVLATAIAFDAVCGNARLNSSIGLPAISARRAASRGFSSVSTAVRNAQISSSCIIAVIFADGGSSTTLSTNRKFLNRFLRLFPVVDGVLDVPVPDAALKDRQAPTAWPRRFE